MTSCIINDTMAVFTTQGGAQPIIVIFDDSPRPPHALVKTTNTDFFAPITNYAGSKKLARARPGKRAPQTTPEARLLVRYTESDAFQALLLYAARRGAKKRRPPPITL